jgi:hypothetical protein
MASLSKAGFRAKLATSSDHRPSDGLPQAFESSPTTQLNQDSVRSPSTARGRETPRGFAEQCRELGQEFEAKCAGRSRGLATTPALRKLTACLVQEGRHYRPSGSISGPGKGGVSVIESTDANGGDDRGNDRFAWIPINLDSHADLYAEERKSCKHKFLQAV